MHSHNDAPITQDNQSIYLNQSGPEDVIGQHSTAQAHVDAKHRTTETVMVHEGLTLLAMMFHDELPAIWTPTVWVSLEGSL